MTSRLVNVVRALALGIVASALAFVVVLFTRNVAAKPQAWLIIAITGLSAISEMYFRSLASDLSTLLRRGTYSTWQIEQLNQTVPGWRDQVWFVWNISIVMKITVGCLGVLLVNEAFTPKYQPIILFICYTLILYSTFFAVWGVRSFRALEKRLDDLSKQEGSLKEKRRLKSQLESPQHDFANDELAKG